MSGDGNASAGDVARSSMKRIHVFRPTSSVQLAVSLLRLPAYHTSHLPDDEIGLIVIDSISSFYWPDRFTLEQINSAGSARRGTSSNASPLHRVLASLQQIRLSHGSVIALTNWGLNPLTKPVQNSGSTILYKQHLSPYLTVPEQHQLNVTQATEADPDANSISSAVILPPLSYHITLPFVSIAQFDPSIMFDDAKEQELKYRQELVTKGEVVGIVRTPGSNRVGRFTFRIGDHEVLVDDFWP
jgi:DNA-repair protein XRCC2